MLDGMQRSLCMKYLGGIKREVTYSGVTCDRGCGGMTFHCLRTKRSNQDLQVLLKQGQKSLLDLLVVAR